MFDIFDNRGDGSNLQNFHIKLGSAVFLKVRRGSHRPNQHFKVFAEPLTFCGRSQRAGLTRLIYIVQKWLLLQLQRDAPLYKAHIPHKKQSQMSRNTDKQSCNYYGGQLDNPKLSPTCFKSKIHFFLNKQNAAPNKNIAIKQE